MAIDVHIKDLIFHSPTAEIEAMKTLTQSLHSENPEQSSSAKKKELPPETTDATAVASDVKRLETKVKKEAMGSV